MMDKDAKFFISMIVLVSVIVIGLVVVMIVSACAPISEDVNEISTTLPLQVTRFYDKEAHVVCWVYKWQFNYDAAGVGLSCLPISETNLDLRY